ncbi:MAG: GDP-L-fucose synthase [Desulfobacterales bacterium]|nr:GDP-L-fucose synthase [Desulfobacterales bacterium]
MIDKNSLIYIAGHTGLAGSALVRRLNSMGCHNLITKNHLDLDLRSQSDVNAFFNREKPEYVILAAAKVGGIWANNAYPAEFIYDNLAIEINIIHASWMTGVKRLIFLGSSCIYPRECPQPMKEEYLLTGPLESTNEPYAIAKIAGIKMCQSFNRQYGTRFLAVMPTNLYGPNDNFNLETSHVLPALIRKFHEAKLNGNKTVTVWGSGTPKREFLHVDDFADACVFIMDMEDRVYDALLVNGKTPLINIGCGHDLTITDLSMLIKEIIGFNGDIVFDSGKPDGPPRKLMDVSRLNRLGWKSSVSLSDGIRNTYQWCLKSRVFDPGL